MTSILRALSAFHDASVVSLLVFGAIVCFLLAILGQYNTIKLAPQNQRRGVLLGLLLLVSAAFAAFIPAYSPESAPALAQPSTAVAAPSAAPTALPEPGGLTVSSDPSAPVVSSPVDVTGAVPVADPLPPPVPAAIQPDLPESAPGALAVAEPTSVQLPASPACRADPAIGEAPNSPVAIVAIDRGAEIVDIQNISEGPVDLSDWYICSIRGNQFHAWLSGSLAPYEVRQIASARTGEIWNNIDPDPGALYDAQGLLISYWEN
jgi:hypothetical protein